MSPVKFAGSFVKNPLKGTDARVPAIEPLAVASINGGMVTSIDGSLIDDTQATDLRNFVVRYGKTTRREGTTIIAPKPDSDKILSLITYHRSDNVVALLRFTKDAVYKLSGSTYTLLTPAAALTGTDDDRFSAAILEDRFFFANNGVDEIQEVNIDTDTYADAGNAPKYKYIAGFGNRLVGANLAGAAPNQNQLGWSGDRNYDEWNPLVDISAGSTILTTSASDSADFITGLTSFANSLQIIREKSIWEGLLQPSATQPFYLYQKYPGVGSDCPYSIAKMPNGLCFVDTRTQTVYHYDISGQIDALQMPIEIDLFTYIKDNKQVFGTYNAKYKEYHILVIDTATQVSRVWVYSFVTKAWWYEEFLNLSIIESLNHNAGSLSIDELTGTIDQLLGTIDELGGDNQVVTLFYGNTTGDILYRDSTVFQDDGEDYTAVRESKVYELPVDNSYFSEVVIEYTPLAVGNFGIYFSRDGGVTFTLVKTISFIAGDLTKNKIARYKKNIMCRRFAWKIESTTGLFDLNKYTVNILPGGEAKK